MDENNSCVAVVMSCGRKFLVDRSGFDKIKHLAWHSRRHRQSGKYYVTHASYLKCEDGRTRSRQIQLARFLMGLQKGDLRVVDHINGDPLDNRWANLRICTNAQNVRNQKINKRNTTGFKGVTRSVRKNRTVRYLAIVAWQGKGYYAGTSKTPEGAHKLYCEKARQLHGEFANFGTVSPTPVPSTEILLPAALDYLRQHLPDPSRHARVRTSESGRVEWIPVPADWREHRSPFVVGPLGEAKLIYDRALRRFRDLVKNGVVREADLPTIVTMLTAVEVRFDRARTVRVSRQKYPVVMQVYRNIEKAGIWREWVRGEGVRWGFEFGWHPEYEEDRRRFGEELAQHVEVGRVGVDKAREEWSLGLRMLRDLKLEAARQAWLARPENQPYPRPPSALRPMQELRKLGEGTKSRFRVVI